MSAILVPTSEPKQPIKKKVPDIITALFRNVFIIFSLDKHHTRSSIVKLTVGNRNTNYIRSVEQLPQNAACKIEKSQLQKDGVTEDTWDRETAGIVLKRERA